MTGFNDPIIESEFLRWSDYMSTDDPLDTAKTVPIKDILRAHFLIADFFILEGGEGISQVGPMDVGLLESAAYRQIAGFEDISKWDDNFQVCATLSYGLIKDHAFFDANKRTALLVLLYHLEKLGRWITIRQRNLDDFVVDIAENRLEKYSEYRRLRKRVRDPEVNFISNYLRRHSRNIDKRDYAITYGELDKRIREYGFFLDNPKKNYIDVVRIRERKRLFGKSKKEYDRITQINFPGWKRRVGRDAVNKVREATGLTADNGYDSKSFFQGSDVMPELISDYSEPLRRLANR